MSEAATDTNWLGETSMYCTVSAPTSVNSPPIRADTISVMKRPDASSGALAWAMTLSSSSSAERYTIRSVTRPFSTSR